MALAKKRKTTDPLSAVRIEPARTADEARADAQRTLADAAAEATAAAAEAPSVVETAATAARVRDEKRLVTTPAKVSQKKLPRFMVMTDQTVTWHGQQLRLKAGKSEVSDERQGPGAIKMFRAMGVKLEEIK